MNDTALVTGSTSGIGRAFAEKLAQQGYNLILVSRNQEKLQKQSDALIKQYAIEAQFICADLERQGAANLVFNKVQELGTSIAVLINNAGFNEYGSFIHTALEKEQEMIFLHILFTTEMMKFFIPQMIEAGAGYILNIGSTGSYMACPNDAVYAATKAYILSLSKGVHAEIKGTGVSITALCPGSTETEFARKAGMQDTLLFKRFVMKPETVAKIGYRAMKQRRVSVVAGAYNKILVFLVRITPHFILSPLTQYMLTSKS